MSHALPVPHRSSLAVPFVALVLGAAGGAAAGLIAAGDDTIVRETPAVVARDLPTPAPPVPARISEAPTRSASLPSTSTPVPERVSGVVAGKSLPAASAPVPERVTAQPARSYGPVPERVTGSLAGTTGSNTPPAPERISGAHNR